MKNLKIPYLYLFAVGGIFLIIFSYYFEFEIKISFSTLVSLALNVALFIIGFYQLIAAKKEEENTKGKVRIWQNQAEGIKNALLAISQNSNNYDSKQSAISAASAVAQQAVAFEKSLVEERFFTDEEVKQNRITADKTFQELIKNLRHQ